MKKTVFKTLAVILILGSSALQTKAQVSVNLNIGTWNPPAEYADASYYYLPDVNSYYYVPTHQYIYLNGNNWVWRNTLPARYSYYNINDGYKVAVYRPHPYRYYYSDRTRYARYRGVKHVIVRDRYYRPRARVVNRVHYVGRPRNVYHTKYVNRRPRVINRTRVVNRPHKTIVHRTRVVNRPAHHARVIKHTKIVRPTHHNGGNHGHGRGHH
ncbi:hypothetical protein ACFQZX_11345 [Mucilaginibacter litoreus]|uniref:YXWGXW repeat-containing protein n=1 Tax=Mucilaginibacter litoreus TaxID=1048221 RepID=A0ABW3AT31_9SPHI